ncbi:MAG: type II secretion system F family protein [Desulfuromonas sp.]|nr:MAG: type II secretion system F family protein [Desulfuromonas sp.]
MPSYLCKIGTADGRVVEKSFEATGKEQLKENLEEQGFFVFQIRLQLFQFLQKGGSRQGSLSGRRFLAFNRELIVLLRSGLPVLQVLDTLVGQMEASGLRNVLTEIREEIKGGSMLSDAFAQYPGYFPHLYVASIRAGEKTGDLAVTLTRYLEYQKRVEAIRAKVRSASFYPILLTSAAVCVLIFLLLYVVPSFTQIYTDANVELPLMTRILIAVSGGLGKIAPLLLLTAIGLFLFFKGVAGTSRGQVMYDRLRLKLPFLGQLLIDYALSSFCRTLGTTLTSGTPLVPAMTMSRGTLNNRILEAEMVKAIHRVEEGTALSDAIQRCGFFPAIALRMIGVGETTGALDEMLEEVAAYYEAEVERRLTLLTTMIEPVLMLGMGLIIGAIVFAMYVPIFQLAGTVG